MQKLIAKYGLAAHLALLAVAPLVLFPFCDEASVAGVLLWMSLIAGLWMFLEPSLRTGELLHDARQRVWFEVLIDPLFWVLLVLVLFAGLQAVNTGISFSYDAETSVWCISPATCSIFPGSVGGSGRLYFAASVAFLVLVQSCRHSLGRSARMAFLLLASVGAGLAAVLMLAAIHEGHAPAIGLLHAAEASKFSFVGYAFGLYLAASLVALVTVFEDKWRMAFFPAMLGIAGTGAGVFAFSAAYLAVGLAIGLAVILAYSVVYVWLTMRSSHQFRYLALVGMALVLGAGLLILLLPDAELDGRLAAFEGASFFSERYWEVRKVLSVVAQKSWVGQLWIGTGLGSFPLDFRFAAQPEHWALLPGGAGFAPNGWYFLLAERGIVGLVLLVFPVGFLLFSYVRRLFSILTVRVFPHPAGLLAPLAVAFLLAGGFFDCSPFRVEALMATGALVAVSAATLPRLRREDNG